VLIHHVDLDLGYRPRNWPAWFTRDTLSRTTPFLTQGGRITAPVRLEATDTGNVFAIGAAGPDSPVISDPAEPLSDHWDPDFFISWAAR
jgi:hypothetical protein